MATQRSRVDDLVVVPGILGSRLADGEGHEVRGLSGKALLRGIRTFGKSVKGPALPADLLHRNLAAGESVATAHATARMMLSLSGCADPPLPHSAVGRLPEAHFLIGPEVRVVPPRQSVKPRRYETVARLRKPRFRPPSL